jgi:hypothetical protein
MDIKFISVIEEDAWQSARMAKGIEIVGHLWS